MYSSKQHIECIIAKAKTLPKHGKAYDSKKEQKKAETVADVQSRKMSSELDAFLEGIPSLATAIESFSTIAQKFITDTTSLSMGLGKVVGIQEQYQKGINKLVQDISYLEQKNSKLNTAFKISSGTAQTYAKKLRDLSISVELAEDKMMGYAVGLKDLTSGMMFSSKANDKFVNNMLLTQTYLQNNLGLTQDAAVGYQQYATTVADSSAEAALYHAEFAKQIASVTGQDALQVQAELMGEIGSLSEDLQLQYSRLPGSLELAVLKSKALGINMEQLHRTGDSLLNIESSIGSELEYQLLTGKRLLTSDGKSLTNAYRMATVQGDATKQAELMNRFIESEGDMLSTNLYARKKAAELMGTDEATLAKMIQKQKLAKELGIERLMELNKGDVTAVVEQLRRDGRDVDEDKIKKLIKLDTTKTTAETANDYLESINSLTIKMAEKQGIDVSTVSKDIMAAVKSEELTGQMTMFRGSEGALGELTITGQTIDSLATPLDTLAKQIPLLGTTISNAIKTITDAMPTLATATTTTTTPVTDTNDALIVPDRGPILRPAPNDVIAAFRPNDVIDRTLKSGGGSIDYNKLAAVLVSAMRSVNLTVKADRDIYAPTMLNPGGRRK
jgi:hypothetical protein